MLDHKTTILYKLMMYIRWCCQPRYRKYTLYQGYRRLSHRGQANLVQKCKHQISLVRTGVDQTRASPDIFFSAQSEADLVIRQYLTKRTGEKSICLSIYNAIGGGLPTHNLPPHTYQVLEKLGIPNWTFASWLRWQVSLVIYWLYGCLIFLKLGRSTKSHAEDTHSDATAFFQDLPANALPNSQTSFERQDLISWYARWPKRNPKLNSISHQNKNNAEIEVNHIKLKYRAAGWQEHLTIIAKLEYLLWGTRVAIMALVDIFRGHWWHALLFSQAVMAKRTAMSEKKKLPAEIWFNHENYKYKPIWVYEAEAQGVKSFCYFYSVNNQTVQPANHEISISGYWHLMNWPRYLIWNEAQKEILKTYFQDNAQFIIASDIPFTDSDEALAPIPLPAIAVFDIPTYKAEVIMSNGQAYKYQTDRVAECFYHDIILAAKSNGCNLCTKQKSGRKSSHLSTRYLKVLDQLEDNDGVYTTAPGIAAHRLIARTAMTISTPYSSTSVIAKALGKPSCYYDPTGLLPDQTIFSHGIEIIKSPEALKNWIRNNKTT